MISATVIGQASSAGFAQTVGEIAFGAPGQCDSIPDWQWVLRERFIRHPGNADVVRQDLLAEKGVTVSGRTLQRAVQPYRQALKAEALATTRFEIPPGRQLQIDFGERLVQIRGAKIKAFTFVATLGRSRRLHVRAFRAEKQEQWFGGIESAFTTFGGVPDEVLMDNPRALVNVRVQLLRQALRRCGSRQKLRLVALAAPGMIEVEFANGSRMRNRCVSGRSGPEKDRGLPLWAAISTHPL